MHAQARGAVSVLPTAGVAFGFAVLLAPQDPGAARAPAAALDAAALERAQDRTGAGEAFVEVVATREAYFLHERIRLRARFGFDAAFLDAHAVQPFRQALDVPAQLVLPWAGGLPHAVVLPDLAGTRIEGAPRATFALGDEVSQARRAGVDGGRVAFEFERDLLPMGAGELVLPAPVLRYAFTSRFEDSPLHGRVPVDRTDAIVRGAALALRILPLPDEDRPPEFTGAVGRFALRAEAHPRELRLGASLELVVHLEGDGNHGFYEPPGLGALPGFHVRGRFERVTASGRAWVYDLAPRSAAAQAIPAIAFAYFDPDPPGAYRTAWTEPIPITVREAPREAPAAGLPAAGARTDPSLREPGAGFAAARSLFVGLAALGALIGLAAIVFLVLRMRGFRRPAGD